MGNAKAFGQLTKRLSSAPGGYAPLRELVRPYILRRLKTDPKVIGDLPPKSELTAFAGLTRAQATLYAKAVKELERDLASADAMARMLDWLRTQSTDLEQLERYAPAVRSAEPEAMRVFLRGVRDQLGSFEGYAAALGLDEEIEALRAALLE